MKRSSSLFLQAAVVLIGVVVLVLMLWEPHLEGRNAHATTFEVYFKDPFLAYVYLGSIPFFVALYRAFGLFGYVRRKGACSQVTMDALRSIQRCAFVLIGFVAGAIVLIALFGDKEDRPPGVFMCLLATCGSVVIATVAAKVRQNLQRALAK